jgi:hypothetical protein
MNEESFAQYDPQERLAFEAEMIRSDIVMPKVMEPGESLEINNKIRYGFMEDRKYD